MSLVAVTSSNIVIWMRYNLNMSVYHKNKFKIARLLVIFSRNCGKIVGGFLNMIISQDKKIMVARLLIKASLKSPKEVHFVVYFFCYEVIRKFFFLQKAPVFYLREIAPNVRMNLNITQKTQLLIAVSKVYELSVTNYVYKRLKEGEMFIDIGANVGYYTLLAANIVKKQGKVISFEPEDNNLNLLKQNISLNNFNNIVLENLALSSDSGLAILNINPVNEGGHSMLDLGEYSDDEGVWSIEKISKKLENFKNDQTVKTVSLDSYIHKHNINLDRNSIVKIDVEGLEEKVLLGMKDIIKSIKPVIICEVGDLGLSFDDLLGWAGYKPYKILKNGSLLQYKANLHKLPKGDYVFTS